MSAAGIPQIAIVMGFLQPPAGAYVSRDGSDESIIVRNQGNDFSRWTAAGEGRDRGSPSPRKNSAALTCIHGNPASPIIMRRTTAMAIGIARRIVATLKPPQRGRVEHA